MNIKKLILFSSNIEKQYHFYTKILGVSKVDEKDNSFTIHVGNTELSFKEDKEATPSHFAINIPSNKINEAATWLKSKGIKLLEDPQDGEVLKFPWIHAQSVYFYDTDKNIVEFIARKKLDNAQEDLFSEKALLEVSEIGLPNTDVANVFEQLKPYGFSVFAGNIERFAMIGDEHGMFLVINTNIKDYWIPTDDKIAYSNFNMIAEKKGELISFSFTKKGLEIS